MAAVHLARTPPCPCRLDAFAGTLLHALQSTMRRRWNPSFFAIARNGGCEQTLRNDVLQAWETAGCCRAFTECDGRADVVLICNRCGRHAARIEFKSNFAVQYGRLTARRQEAIKQLRAGHRSPHRIFVHLVTELCAEVGSPVATAQRLAYPKTKYKWFADAQEAGRVLGEVHKRLPANEAFVQGLATRSPMDPTAAARLWAWAYAVPRRGEGLRPLP